MLDLIKINRGNTKRQLKKFIDCLTDNDPKELKYFLDANPDMKKSIVFRRKWFDADHVREALIDNGILRQRPIINEKADRLFLRLYEDDCRIETERIILSYYKNTKLNDGQPMLLGKDQLEFIAGFLSKKGILDSKIRETEPMPSPWGKYNLAEYVFTEIYETKAVSNDMRSVVYRETDRIIKYPNSDQKFQMLYVLYESFKILSDNGFDFSLNFFYEDNVFDYLFSPSSDIAYCWNSMHKMGFSPIQACPDIEKLANITLTNGGRRPVTIDNRSLINKWRFVQLLSLKTEIIQTGEIRRQQIVMLDGEQFRFEEIKDEDLSRVNKEIYCCMDNLGIDFELDRNCLYTYDEVEALLNALLRFEIPMNPQIVEDLKLLDKCLSDIPIDTYTLISQLANYIRLNFEIKDTGRRNSPQRLEIRLQAAGLVLNLFYKNGIDPWNDKYYKSIISDGEDDMLNKRIDELTNLCLAVPELFRLINSIGMNIIHSYAVLKNVAVMPVISIYHELTEEDLALWKQKVGMILSLGFTPMYNNAYGSGKTEAPELIAHSLLDSFIAEWGEDRDPYADKRINLYIKQKQNYICEMFMFLHEKGIDLFKKDPLSGKSVMEKCLMQIDYAHNNGVESVFEKLYSFLEKIVRRQSEENYSETQEIEMEW